jgi:hypothetical protein
LWDLDCFFFFVSLLMVLGGFQLDITVGLGVFIRKRTGVWHLDAGRILGMLFQLAVSPFKWIDRVLRQVVDMVGRMVNEEAAQGRTVEGAL